MRKTALIIALLIAISIVHANPLIKPYILSYNPSPAAPGKLVEVWIQLYNDGTDTARNIQLEIVNNTVFKPYNTQTKYLFKEIPPKQGVITKLILQVDRNAVQGINYLHIRYSQGDTWVTSDLPIEVALHAPTLVVKQITLNPSIVKQGQKVNLSLILSNQGSYLLKDITVSISTQDQNICSSQGCQIIKNPFYPLTTTNYVIPSITPGHESIANFALMIDPSIDSGLYKLPVTITFYDEQNNKHELTQQVTIPIKNTPKLALSIDSIKYGNPIEINLLISNIGLENIKALTITNITGTKILYPLNNYYVGDLDKDDDSLIKVGVNPLSNNFNLKISYEYLDSMNNPHKEQATVHIELQQRKSHTVVYIAILIVLVIAVIIYKKRK